MRTSIIVLLAGAIVCTSTAALADDVTVAVTSPPPPAPSRASIEDSGHLIVDRVVSYSAVSGGVVAFGGIVGYSSGIVEGTTPSPTSTTPTPSSSRATIAWLGPSADYVFAKRLTLGASIGISNIHTRRTGDAPYSTGEDNWFNVTIVPRVGYIRAISDDLSIWTRVGVGGTESITGSSESSSGWEVDADSLLVLRAGRHLMANIGPTMRYARTRVRPTSSGSDGIDGSATGFSLGARVALGLVF
jgi:hypothetical protein